MKKTILTLAIALLSLAGYSQTKTNAKTKTHMYKPGKNDVSFQSEGEQMAGHLYLPSNYKSGDRLPLVIVTGSWTTVKEMMAGTYANKLADKGYAALTFDFRFFGESGGLPRQYENPQEKIKDIKNAASWASTLPIVDKGRIGGLGICASAGYMVTAVAESELIKSISLVAPWIHDFEIVKQIYGGADGVNQKIAASKKAEEIYGSKKVVDYVPVASISDNNAIMFMPMAVDDKHWDYYVKEDRGSIRQWRNQLLVMSWEPWLTFDGVKAAPKIKVPVLMVNSESMAVPQGAKQFYASLSSQKREVWIPGLYQLDFYDYPEVVDQSTKEVAKHFTETL